MLEDIDTKMCLTYYKEICVVAESFYTEISLCLQRAIWKIIIG